MSLVSSPAHQRAAVALTIAGSDSGGGAGIQADLKAFSALGVYGTSVITALTAQNTQEVRAIHPAPPHFIADQINTVLDDIEVDAIKIGMLGDPAVIETVAGILRERHPENIVLDPVMIAKSGDKLLADEAVITLREQLLPLATIVTPNLPEAAVLLNCNEATDAPGMHEQAAQLHALGAGAVLIKGGHLNSNVSNDLLYQPPQERWLPTARINTKNTHGTGCTLSSAIAAGLAKGEDLDRAVTHAKSYITAAIAAADRLAVGHGHGPTHHFHNWW